MRIFLGIVPAAAARDAACRVVEALRRPRDGVAWVRPENLHYTLRFMGELDEPAVGRVTAAAGAAAAEHTAFPLVLGGPGAFPEPRRARVLWLGAAAGGGALAALAASLERALVAAGFAPAERPFTPHLTLGRIRGGGEDWSARLAEAGAAFAAEAPPSFLVDRVCVVHSTLAPGAAVHRVRAEAALAG